MKLQNLAILAAALTASLPQTTYARDDAARLMLKCDGTGEIHVVSTSDGAKILDPQPNAITLEQPTTADRWTTASLKFKTTTDCDVRLRLGGTYTKAGDRWVYIDNLKAEGVQVENPDFETNGDKAPTGWKFLQSGQGSAAQIHDASAAASGENFVKVSHGCPAVQMIHVPKDTEVTLTFSARTAPNNP